MQYLKVPHQMVSCIECSLLHVYSRSKSVIYLWPKIAQDYFLPIKNDKKRFVEQCKNQLLNYKKSHAAFCCLVKMCFTCVICTVKKEKFEKYLSKYFKNFDENLNIYNLHSSFISKIEKPILCSTSAAQADRPRFLTGEGCK